MIVQQHWIDSHLARGNAVCPGCGLAHPEAGWEHTDNGPWRITPRCIDCGKQLRMPHRPEEAA